MARHMWARLGYGGVHRQVQGRWDSHALSSERYLFIQSVVKQILRPGSHLGAGLRGLGCFFTFLGSQTLQKVVKECVCWREDGREGEKRGRRRKEGVRPLPCQQALCRVRLTPTEWVAPGIPPGDCGQGGQGLWSPSPLSLAPDSQDPTCQESV